MPIIYLCLYLFIYLKISFHNYCHNDIWVKSILFSIFQIKNTKGKFCTLKWPSMSGSSKILHLGLCTFLALHILYKYRKILREFGQTWEKKGGALLSVVLTRVCTSDSVELDFTGSGRMSFHGTNGWWGRWWWWTPQWSQQQNSVEKKADTTIDLQFWSADPAMKLRITSCLLHICHMLYFLSILGIWRHFPNVDLSKGPQHNRYRLVIFESRGSASHFHSTCPARQEKRPQEKIQPTPDLNGREWTERNHGETVDPGGGAGWGTAQLFF